MAWPGPCPCGSGCILGLSLLGRRILLIMLICPDCESMASAFSACTWAQKGWKRTAWTPARLGKVSGNWEVWGGQRASFLETPALPLPGYENVIT